jgi:hypothetical protein
MTTLQLLLCSSLPPFSGVARERSPWWSSFVGFRKMLAQLGRLTLLASGWAIVPGLLA